MAFLLKKEPENGHEEGGSRKDMACHTVDMRQDSKGRETWPSSRDQPREALNAVGSSAVHADAEQSSMFHGMWLFQRV